MEPQTPEAPAVEQTPVQPVNQAAEIIGDDGKFTQSFRDALPDDLGKHSWFDKYSDITEAVKGSINGQNLVSKKAEDFWSSEDPADIAKRQEIMGVAKEVGEYEYNLGDLPEGMDAEKIEESIGKFKEFALEKGWPKEFVQQAIEYDMQQGIAQMEQNDASSEMTKQAAEAELRKEWTGNKFEYNVSKAKDALEYLGLGEWVNNPAFGNDPQFIKDVSHFKPNAKTATPFGPHGVCYNCFFFSLLR